MSKKPRQLLPVGSGPIIFRLSSGGSSTVTRAATPPEADDAKKASPKAAPSKPDEAKTAPPKADAVKTQSDTGRKSKTQVAGPPPNPTSNWRETDKKMMEDMNVDKNKFAAKKSKSQTNLKGKPAAGAFAIAIVEIEIPDLVVVVEAGGSSSAPNLGNGSVVKPPQKPFDPKILDDPEVLALTLPDENAPNYVQCPHCGKRFEPVVAAPRHIAQCKDMHFNAKEKEKFAASKKNEKKK